MTQNIDCAKQNIRSCIASSVVPEDSLHAENTLKWLLVLEPDANLALQLAALGHDIDRATEETKVSRAQFDDYDEFKAAHARKGAEILRTLLSTCGVKQDIVNETCRLVVVHEVGGDSDSDLLKDADSISFFDVNLPFYYQREGWTETKRRSVWGYQRLSPQSKEIVKHIRYEVEAQSRLMHEVIEEGSTNV